MLPLSSIVFTDNGQRAHDDAIENNTHAFLSFPLMSLLLAFPTDSQFIVVPFVPLGIHRIPCDSLAVAICGSDGRIHTFRADVEARVLVFDEVLCGLILPEVDKPYKSE